MLRRKRTKFVALLMVVVLCLLPMPVLAAEQLPQLEVGTVYDVGHCCMTADGKEIEATSINCILFGHHINDRIITIYWMCRTNCMNFRQYLERSCLRCSWSSGPYYMGSGSSGPHAFSAGGKCFICGFIGSEWWPGDRANEVSC